MFDVDGYPAILEEVLGGPIGLSQILFFFCEERHYFYIGNIKCMWFVCF